MKIELATYKPDIEEAEKRWQAFYEGELIDRPPICVVAPNPNCKLLLPITYKEKVFDPIDSILDHAEKEAENTFWGGEAIPSFYPSFGPDEIAVFTGAELNWSPDSPDTNWSVPFVENWEETLPLKINPDNLLLQRQLEIYRQAADRFRGSILLVFPDLHSNMDLLSGIRGNQNLCMDLIDNPQIIDKAVHDARLIFRQLWIEWVHAGKMNTYGYCLESHALLSSEGSATLQCDFSIMMSPQMFKRWVLPALEEEASLAKHVVYHWDGFGALVHQEAILACKGLQTISFVPGAGHGDPVDHIELLKSFQSAGKSVHAWGTPEQCMKMHKELQPEKVFYCTQTETQKEAEELLLWFKLNT